MEYLDTFASSESYFLSSDGAASEWYNGWYTSWYVCAFTGYLYLPSSLSYLFPSAVPSVVCLWAQGRYPNTLSVVCSFFVLHSRVEVQLF